MADLNQPPGKAQTHDAIAAFDALWADYPARNGSNPKIKAFRAWKARIDEGYSDAEMHSGTRRYAAWCAATGKLNTEFVQQASTFLGPQKGFAEPWDLPATPTATNPLNGIDRFDAHAKHARLVAANQAAMAEWLAQEDSANPWGITVLQPPELSHATH